jgi:hypothetical protein
MSQRGHVGVRPLMTLDQQIKVEVSNPTAKPSIIQLSRSLIGARRAR